MKKALVVGINDYPGAQLKCCENDAYAVSNALERNSDGSPNFSVITCTNPKTKGELRSMIKDLFKGESETALFYFSGHGYLDGIGGYIVTPDFEQDDYGIPMTEILNLANKSKIRNKIIILDCCNSGRIGSPEISDDNSSFLNEGLTILTASKADEESVEINGHGVFTNLLLDALHGGAADLQGRITPGSVYAYIDQALGPWAQRPVFKTNISQFVSLKEVTPQIPMTDIRKIVELFETPQDSFDLDPSFEDTNNPEIEHKVIEPFSNAENVEKFKILQRFESVGLVTPSGEDHMYFAAMNSKSCRLTALGYHYWRLVKENIL